MACPCSPLRGSSFEFIYSVPGGPIPVGWCATHGAAVRGHVREQGRSVGGAADHWPGNLEGGESRRQAGRHTRVASAHAAQSCYAKPNTCDWRRDSCGTRTCKPPPTTRRSPSRIFGKDWWTQRDLPPSGPEPAVLLGGHCPSDLAWSPSNPCLRHDHILASAIASLQPKTRRDDATKACAIKFLLAGFGGGRPAVAYVPRRHLPHSNTGRARSL